MDEAWRYWQMVRIDEDGVRRVEISQAKALFQQQFPHWQQDSDLSDLQVQQQLKQLWQETTDATLRQSVESCLRCCISNEMEKICRDLEQRFGKTTGIQCIDLLSLILDSRPFSCHSSLSSLDDQPLTDRILQTFDGTRSRLSTWTRQLVYGDDDFYHRLMEHGICLLSDWAALNAIRDANGLRRILTEFFLWSKAEVDWNCHLLTSYHAVYRRDRRQQKKHPPEKPAKRRRDRCEPPTPAQLQEMFDQLQSAPSVKMRYQSPQEVLEALQELAAKIRQYRIAVYLKQLPVDSLDQQQYDNIITEQLTSNEEDQEENIFLTTYHQELLNGLDLALDRSIQNWIAAYRRKRPPRDRAFLDALHRFHCQQQGMKEIAPLVGLSQQYQVARLLKLKDLRADVQHHLLDYLLQQIRELARDYADPDRLHMLDQLIEAALKELIDQMLAEAEAESFTNNRNSLFTCRLCHYLKHLN